MEHRCLSGREQRVHCRREEVEIAGEPEALVRCFDKLELPVGRIGLEVGPSTRLAGSGACGRRTAAVSPLNADPTSFPETPIMKLSDDQQ